MQSRDADDAVSFVSDRALIGVAIAFSAALAAVLWVWGLPLGNDGATHVFQTYVSNHYADTTLGYARFYELMSPPTSNGFSDVQRVLEPVFGWQTAWRLNVIVACELWAVGFLLFVRALSRARAPAGLLGFPLSLQACLWLGLMPFVYATAIGWLALALWLSRPPSVVTSALLALIMTACARAHVVPAALVGGILLVVTLAREPAGVARMRAVGWLSLAGVPAVWIAVRALGAETTSDAEPLWPSVMDRVWVVGSWFQAGPRWRHVFATALVVLGLAGIVLRARERTLSQSEKVAALIGTVIIMWTPALPEHIGTWELGGLRALPIGVGLVLAFLPCDRARWRAGVLAAVGAYALASFAWAFDVHMRLRAATAPALAGLSLPKHPVERVAILMDDGVPSALRPVVGFNPLLHVSNLYTLARGGMDPYGHHGEPQKHQLRVRAAFAVVPPSVNTWAEAGALDGPARAGALRQLLARTTRYPELVLVGRRVDIEVARAAGYEPELETDALLIARFEGCNGQITLDGPALEAASQPGAALGPLDVVVGWWPSRTPTLEFNYTPGPGAPTAFPLERLGCGDVWLSVSSQTGARCAGVAPGMPVRSTFAPGADNVLRCTVVTAPEDGSP